MQVPEKLTLIGGSILLASTLIFTLKSQASNILPKVDSGMSSLVNDSKSGQSSNDSSQKQQQAQVDQAFNSNFQQAQQKGWQTGTWGTAKFYVDDQGNMHVGSGQLESSYTNVAEVDNIVTINLDGSVQAPQNSHNLFDNAGAEVGPLQHINNLDRLDTSNVTSMSEMFDDDSHLRNLDVSHFDTHNVTDMRDMFSNESSLSNLDLSHFDTHNVNNMEDMFAGDSSITSLDVSNFDTHNVTTMYDMFIDNDSLNNLNLSHFNMSNATNVNMIQMFFNNISLSHLELGQDTKLDSSTLLPGTYRQGTQTLNLDGNAHPGTWTKQ